MQKLFEAEYESNHIKVRNTWFNGEQLYVNDELQDENLGLAFRSTLYGRIKTSEKLKVIKVTLGGNIKMNCNIFVDHEKIDDYIVKSHRRYIQCYLLLSYTYYQY